MYIFIKTSFFLLFLFVKVIIKVYWFWLIFILDICLMIYFFWLNFIFILYTIEVLKFLCYRPYSTTMKCEVFRISLNFFHIWYLQKLLWLNTWDLLLDFFIPSIIIMTTFTASIITMIFIRRIILVNMLFSMIIG